jgi:hypothetical protein
MPHDFKGQALTPKEDGIQASQERLDHNMKGQKRHIHTEKNVPPTSTATTYIMDMSSRDIK